ncbi:hypothetical protein AGMMS50239_02140 [Bacteroidia bacterium]|nr:hypothetical protein AGMMS50239_02140 [Bacteroidia bacterium]
MLSQKQIDIIIDSMMPYNSVRIGIFGSVARNEETENSDIDILYSFKQYTAMNDGNLFRLGHIRDCIAKVEYLANKLHNYDNFEKQWVEQDAIIRNLEIIDEASVKKQIQDIITDLGGD